MIMNYLPDFSFGIIIRKYLQDLSPGIIFKNGLQELSSLIILRIFIMSHLQEVQLEVSREFQNLYNWITVVIATLQDTIEG